MKIKPHLHLIALSILSSLIPHPSSLHAAVPLRWTVETSRVQPAVFDVVHGESIELEAAMQNYGNPLSMAGKSVSIFWQTNGMESAWWSAPATVRAAPARPGASTPTNVLAATFTPAMDPGSATVTGFLGATGDIYRAAFTLRFRKGPGAVPNVIEQPPRVLDLAHTTVINQPWPTQADFVNTTTVMKAELKAYVDSEIEGAGLVSPQFVTNTVTGVVTKQFVEGLGIESGLDTNAVATVITNHVSDGYLATGSSVDAKREKTDLVVYENRWDLSGIRSIYPTFPSTAVVESDHHWGAGAHGYVLYIADAPDGDILAVDFNHYYETKADADSVKSFTISASLDYPNTIGMTVSNRCVRTEDTLAKSSDMTSKADKSTTIQGYGITDAYTKNQSDARYAPTSTAVTVTAHTAQLSQLSQSVAAASSKADQANLYSSGIYQYMTGNTNAWFSGTNYVTNADATNRTHFVWESGMDAATVPCSFALWEIRDGQRQQVWDQRDWTVWYWNFKAAQMRTEIAATNAAIYAYIDSTNNHAWARRYASSGRINPDRSTTYVDTPKICLSPGMNWETVASVSGCGYWTIVGNGAVIGGSGTNAVLQIKDFEGNEVMTVTKGAHQLVWLDSNDFTGRMTDGNGWVCFDMMADAQPVGYFSTTLEAEDFTAETSANCPAQYRWENLGNGEWRVHFLLKPGIVSDACFAKFQAETQGQTTIRYNAGLVISGGLIYNGVKIVPVIPNNASAGTTITWVVAQ